MYQDYKDLLSAFHAHGVRYLSVGGYAVIFHAQPRFTRDLDLFIKADSAYAQAKYAALASFDTPPSAAASSVLDAIRMASIFFVTSAVSILTPRGKGAWKATVDPDTGLKASFISRDDLIAAKLAAARP